MPPKFNGFTVEEPSSTRVDMPMPIVDNPRRHGLISEYNPNLIDKIGNLVPDTGIGGVLKGLYSGTDRNVFGLLPSGNYETVSPESDLGEDISFLADPIAGWKGLKHAVSGGTPVSRLLANSIAPKGYSNKFGELKRVLTNKKAFKGAVIDDMPQYDIGTVHEDRLFAWRTKFGLGRPSSRYNQNLDQLRFYNYGKPEGLHKFFSPDGMEWSEVYWYNGKMWSGVQKKWGTESSTEGKKIAAFDGQLIKEIHYENGMEIKKMKWFDGRLIKEIHYENGIEIKEMRW